MFSPTVGVGTEFPAGVVVAIKNDHVVLETCHPITDILSVREFRYRLEQFTFSQIEGFVNDQRSLSQA